MAGHKHYVTLERTVSQRFCVEVLASNVEEAKLRAMNRLTAMLPIRPTLDAISISGTQSSETIPISASRKQSLV